ncbi:MAG TPA: response regulator [Urbifossiella sp.]|nr:response regulator [Urbifossiella sp.]
MDNPNENRVDRPAVLVVEDESSILLLTHLVLERAGYDVIDAADGAAALAAFRDDVQIVVLDLNLPDCSGWDVFAELRRRRPNLRVVITTGERYEEPTSDAPQPLPTDVLPKPYRPADLVAVVGRVLAAR